MITFREFLLVCEKKNTTPPHAVAGTYQQHSDGGFSYTLSDAPVKSTKGSAKKVIQSLEKQGGTGGKAIEKMLKKRVKSVKKIKEDLETRRAQLKQRQLDQVAAHKERVASYQAQQRKKRQASSERESLKQEIKRELQAEQTPTMEPNLYSQQVARRQAAQKTSQIKHVHQEIGAEARSQEAAKQRRLKAILSR